MIQIPPRATFSVEPFAKWSLFLLTGLFALSADNPNPPNNLLSPLTWAAPVFGDEAQNKAVLRDAQNRPSIKPRTAEDPVAVRLVVSRGSANIGDTLEISAVLTIDPGYEIQALECTPYKMPTRLGVDFPPGIVALEEWQSPTPQHTPTSGGHTVYSGEVRFTRKIRISERAQPADYLLNCSVSYQACDSSMCLRPAETELAIKISVSPRP